MGLIQCMGVLFSLVLVYNKQVISHKQENKHVLITHKDNEGVYIPCGGRGGGGCCNKFELFYIFRFIFMSRFMIIFVKEHSTTIKFPSMFPCVASIVCMDYFGLHFPNLLYIP
jgi:hypothetical protein